MNMKQMVIAVAGVVLLALIFMVAIFSWFLTLGMMIDWLDTLRVPSVVIISAQATVFLTWVVFGFVAVANTLRTEL